MGEIVSILTGAILGVIATVAVRERARRRAGAPTPVASTVRAHFAPAAVGDLAIFSRQFPHRVRADLQHAIESFVSGGPTVHRFVGLSQPYEMGGVTLHDCLTANDHNPVVLAAPAYEDLDIGDEVPVRCLKTGLWLLEEGGVRFVLLATAAMLHGQPSGVRCELAARSGDAAASLAARVFRALETAVAQARTYRGKILSLEASGQPYLGRSVGIRVHRLKTVDREDVILPKETLALLERNVVGFVARRPALAAAGQPVKKGLLFYGPPGTGKTHTIHYLAGALPGQTTLLVTAEQQGLLGEYMDLARLLAPSVVVIEDVDLIATDRQFATTCEETVLNRLLNEMDGLRPDAEILFLLTTNRPEALEKALSSRPGRVDQAIEFPLPDEDGRGKLLRLYARGAALADDFVPTIARRTAGVSAAFEKELMRRSVQFHLERGGSGPVDVRDAESALEEMLFRGGSLNLALLGGAGLRAGEGDGQSASDSTP